MKNLKEYCMYGKKCVITLSLFLILVFSHFLITSCEGIDCTLDNVVTLNIGFYDSNSGSKVNVTDTLSVTAEGTDSILLNRAVRVGTVSLPMSYWQEADTLHLTFNSQTGNIMDIVLRVGKTNTQHYESPDCPTTMFHELTSLDFDDPFHLTDSIIIQNTTINYAALENIRIYLRTDTE